MTSRLYNFGYRLIDVNDRIIGCLIFEIRPLPCILTVPVPSLEKGGAQAWKKEEFDANHLRYETVSLNSNKGLRWSQAFSFLVVHFWHAEMARLVGAVLAIVG